MNLVRSLSLLVATLCALPAVIRAAEPASPVLRFSAIPDQDETRLREKFQPLASHLARALGVPVEYVHATVYSDAVELFKNGDVQLAWFGGLTGAQARHAVPAARAIVQGAEDPEYFSYFIAHRDSGIEPGDGFPMALAGRKFAFGAAGSTSGRLMPEHFIRLYTGKAPRDFLGLSVFSGSHDRTAELVGSGQLEAGALGYTIYDRRVAEGTTDPELVRVIWKTPTYADYNFTAHPMLETMFGAGFIDRLQRTLIAIDDPALLAAFPRRKLIPAQNSDFDDIHRLAVELGFIREP